MLARPKVVRSPGWDPGHHEELRNGPEVKIYIWKVVFGVPEKVSIFSVLYREASRMFRRVPWWGPLVQNVPHGPRGGAPALHGPGAQPHLAHAHGIRG